MQRLPPELWIELLSGKPAQMASLDAYAIGKVIGKGSYGEVFLAKHREDRQQVSCASLELGIIV